VVPCLYHFYHLHHLHHFRYPNTRSIIRSGHPR
jgi:hypothetical protein